jgi:hypothetical protein
LAGSCEEISSQLCTPALVPSLCSSCWKVPESVASSREHRDGQFGANVEGFMIRAYAKCLGIEALQFFRLFYRTILAILAGRILERLATRSTKVELLA